MMENASVIRIVIDLGESATLLSPGVDFVRIFRPDLPSVGYGRQVALENSWIMAKKKQVSGGGSATNHTDIGGSKTDFKCIMKDIEFLGSTHMTWKEKKELESKKVVSLGGKPPKRQRLPLSVARVSMKKQKEREEKMLQENLVLGRFSSNRGRDVRKAERRRSEDRVLKSTEGHFRNGVLDVKHLLRPSASKVDDRSVADKKKKKKGGKNTRGKRNGGRKHR